MEPAFREFDRVLTYNWGKLRKGSVVVFLWRSSYLIKRVARLNGDLIYVEGDNKAKSSELGPVKYSDIVGRVFLKY